MAAWMLHGLRFGGKPGQETVFFRAKWLRPAMKGTSCGARRVRLGSNRARLVPPLCVLQWVVVHVCVVLCVSWLSGCRSQCNGCMIVVVLCCHVRRCGLGTWSCKTHCNGCMDVTWASFWGKAGAGNLVFFRVKWLRPAMKGTSCVRRVQLGSNRARLVPPLCSAMSGCSCVRSSMRFLTLWLQIAV